MISYQGRQIPETFEEIVDPNHTALIVHEMLNDAIAKGGLFDKSGRRIDTSGILGPMVSLIDEARKKGVKVIYVRFTTYTDYRTYSDPMIQRAYAAIMDPKGRPQLGSYGTWGHEIIDKVKPHKSEEVINKYKVDAFIGTNLDFLLRANGIRTIVIVGVGAEAGIVPTVSHASNLGYFVVAPEDCILPGDPQWGDIAMKLIGRLAIMNSTSDVMAAWSSS